MVRYKRHDFQCPGHKKDPFRTIGNLLNTYPKSISRTFSQSLCKTSGETTSVVKEQRSQESNSKCPNKRHHVWNVGLQAS